MKAAVFPVIYRIIWLLSLMNAAFGASATFLKHNSGNGFDLFLAAIFGIVIFILLSLIYFDLENIEKLGEGDHDYTGFVGRRHEIFLRGAIVVFLLLGAGELVHTIMPALEYWFKNTCDPRVCLNEAETVLSVSKSVNNLSSIIFSWASAATFFLILIWNIRAFVVRNEGRKLREAKLTSDDDVVDDYLVSTRVVIFAGCALICLIYWGTALILGPNGGLDTVKVLFLLLVLLFLSLLATKLDPFRGWLKGKIKEILLPNRSEA